MFGKLHDIYEISRVKNSVIGMWLKSIAVLLCVAILFTFQSYLVSEWLFKRSADQANKLLMNQIAVAIDTEIHSAQQMLRKLLMTSNVSRIAQAEDIYDIRLTPYKMELIEQMNFYCQISDLVDDIEMYFPEQDYIMASKTLAGSAIMHYADYKDYVEDYDTWQELFLNHGTGDVFIMNTTQNQPRTGKSNMLFYVQSGEDVPGGAKAVAYFSIEGASFSPQISAMSAGNDIALLQTDGSVFVSSNYDFFSSLSDDAQLLTALSECTTEITRLAMRSGSVYIIKSAYADICYIIHASGEHGGYGFLPLAIASAMGIVGIIIVALLLLLRYTENSITPLAEIRSLLATGELRQEDSELQQIRDAIYSSHEQVATISSQLDMNQSKLQRSYLQALLLGSAANEDHENMISELKFDCPNFAVMIFALVDNNVPLSENTGAAVFLVLRYDAMSQAMLGMGITLKYLLFDDIFVMVANINDAMVSSWDDLASSGAHDLLSAWGEQFDNQLAYAYSNVHAGADGIARGYTEARLAMRYKLAHDLAYPNEAHAAVDKTRYYFPAGERNRLANLIKTGSGEEIERMIEELWQANANAEFRDILLDCLSNEIAGAILSAQSGAGNSLEEERDFFTNLAYMQKQRPEYRKETLCRLADIAAKWSRVDRVNEQTDFYADIVQYVEDNYANPALSVESICAYFGRSHNTVYAAVKACSGEGVLNLINITRLRHAKELILQPGMTVEKTAQSVGLNSSLALFRIFKRYEGITPSQFVDQNKS